MTLDWSVFTPGPAAAGGLLIGAAAVLLMLGPGASPASAASSAIAAARAGRRLAARVPAGPVRVPWFYQLYAALPPATIEAGPLRLVVAGLLVGLGTRYASGCTSGHGVCGLSRGSRRSLAATALFMGRASPSSTYAPRAGA